jgi:hypothetical protein
LIDVLADLFEGSEQIHAQYLLAIGAVESFYKSVLIKFAWLDARDERTVASHPGEEYLTEQLRAVIYP